MVLGINALSFKEATSTLFAIFIMKLKRFSHRLNFKNNGPVLLFKTIFRHRNCFLSPGATDGKDGYGLKVEKVGLTFSTFNAMPAKLTKKIIMVIAAL